MRNQTLEETVIIGLLIVTSFLICGRIGYNIGRSQERERIELICTKYSVDDRSKALCVMYGRDK